MTVMAPQSFRPVVAVNFQSAGMSAALAGLLFFIFSSLSSAAPINVEGLGSGEAGRVMGKIEGRMEFINTRPATAWRARDAAWLFQRALEEDGYVDARVRERIEGNAIILQVTAGVRHHLAGVVIEGVDKREARRLGQLFSLPARENESFFRGVGPWVDGDTKRALGLLVSDFQSRGYWTPDVKIRQSDFDPATGANRFVISTNPGPSFTIGATEFSGQLGLPAGDLQTIAAPFPGQVADTVNLNRLRAAVESAYIKAGYQFATVSFSSRLGQSTLVPLFDIQARQKFSLGEITVNGLVRTSESRIQGLYDTIDRSTFNSNALDVIDRRLMGTGAFSSIHRELIMGEDGVIDLNLQFEEARARGVALTAGVGSYEGLIAGASWYDRNADGRLGGYSIGAEWSNRSLLGIWRWTQPMFPGLDDNLTARIQALSQTHEGYDTNQLGGEFGWTRQFSPAVTGALMLHLGQTETSATGLPKDALGPTSYQDYGVRIEGRVNHFDNPASPNRGWRTAAWLESGVLSEGGEYWQAGAEASFLHPIATNDWLALRAAVEVIDSSSDTSLPIDQRLFLGGPNSVRGFPERELGPAIEGYPLGGQGAWSASVEHLHRIAGPLKSVVFFDAGSLSSDANPFGGDELETAAGLGLRVDLPIGAIRFEYGHLLSRDQDQPAGAFHFAIGLKF